MGIATTRRLVAASFFPEEVDDHSEQALHIQRTDHDEIAIHILGLGASDNVGSLYLTDESAKALRVALEQALLEQQTEPS